jgi:hypothetical protein
MSEENKNINNQNINNQNNNIVESKNKEKDDQNTIIIHEDEKKDDNYEYDEETLKRLHEIEELIDESNKPAETNLLENLKFKKKEDKFVFNRLPLSDWEKEQLIKEIYNIR